MKTMENGAVDNTRIWTLWYKDTKNRERFVGSFSSDAEAKEYASEGLGHLKRDQSRYTIKGIDPRSVRV